MPSPQRPSPRRTEALTRSGIVAVAIQLLDGAGENGLTTRAMSQRLATGTGAIYHHVGTKNDLLAAATDAVVSACLDQARRRPAGSPRAELHVLASGLHDAMTSHPWLSAQIAAELAHSPWDSVTLHIMESIGRQVIALGVPEVRWFTTASTLLHYILGAAGLNSADSGSGRSHHDARTRNHTVHAAAAAWEQLQPGHYPFTHAIAGQLRAHDDRTELLAGLDLVIDGITATSQPVS